MTALQFSMVGDPRGKGRPRATVRMVGRKPIATIYTDPKTRRYESSVRSVAQKAMAGLAPLEGPLSVSLRFRLAVPKSTPKYLRSAYLTGEDAYLGAFDVDNLAKSILDGCNGACWGDDRQIVRLFVTKVAAEKPGVDIRVEAFAPQSAEAAP